MYKVENWDYSESPEQLEKLINIIQETKQVVVLCDADFPTGRGVFYFGKLTDENMEECEHICKELNIFHEYLEKE